MGWFCGNSLGSIASNLPVCSSKLKDWTGERKSLALASGSEDSWIDGDCAG